MICAWTLAAAPQARAEELARWRYSKSIHFNTSANGANVPADVRDFPVAVRLDASNFDFSQAQADGADIRFSSGPAASDSRPKTFDSRHLLPFSIESWDRSRTGALVWVKVPVVRGNSTSQLIFMHWGNPEAAAAGDSKAVFDVGEGFVGVWHLDEAGNTNEGGFKDATANAAHGAGINLAAGSRADGRLGHGLLLRQEVSQWVKIDGEKRKLFDLTNQLTFSIWAKAHRFANRGDPAKRALPGYETMFAKGDNSWRLQKFGIRSWHKPPAELIEICVERKQPRADLCVVGRTDMATNQWFHFVGVHDHPQARLYVNGVLDKAETFDSEWMSGDHPVGIGNQSQFPQQGRFWDGVLDEARVLSVVKDEHWIKLDYESQREGQIFLTFGKTTIVSPESVTQARSDGNRMTMEIVSIDRERILKAASAALAMEPPAITKHRAKLSEGGPNDFYSNGDYWWPDPAKPDGLPYVQRDGESNPNNFFHHRMAVRELRDAVAALAAAYKVTGENRYASKAVELLRSFFLDPNTRMNPHLKYAQAIPGRTSGRGIGIIDTLHLAEVPLAIEAMKSSTVFPQETTAGLQRWFADYLEWMFTSKNGKEEAAAKNNHSVAYFLQVACFARFTGDQAKLAQCRRQFREVFVPNQMAADGSFPAELKRTKPYGYSIFQLDNMATLCQVLSTPADSLWRFQLADGRGIRKALAFLHPYLADKSTWPYPRDIQSWEGWPARQPSLLFAGVAFGEQKYFDLWRKLPADPADDEVRRNMAITQPVLWVK